MESTLLIPFGKYKDQPLEVLKNDPKYVEWILAQDWFANRFPNLKTVIINNFQEPQDTPIHNELMACFLSDRFCQNLINVISPGWVKRMKGLMSLKYSDILDERVTNRCIKAIPRYDGFTVQSIFKEPKNQLIYSISEREYRFYKKFEAHGGADLSISAIYKVTYEFAINQFIVNDNDYYHLLLNGPSFTIQKIIHSNTYSIEVKPIVSDDFPTVIRQCRAQKSEVLIIKEFTGKGASIEQVRAMFPDIKIILFSEIPE